MMKAPQLYIWCCLLEDSLEILGLKQFVNVY